jgi:hypothetical protein
MSHLATGLRTRDDNGAGGDACLADIDESLGKGIGDLSGVIGRAFMIALHLSKAHDGVCLHVSIDDLVMKWAEQKKIIKGIALLRALSLIVARPAGTFRTDVCYFATDVAGDSVDHSDRTMWEGTPIAR